MDAPMKLAILQNDISQGEFAVNIEVPVEINDYSLVCNYFIINRIPQVNSKDEMIGTPSENATPT
jgi:hypothetical protein